MHPDWDDGKCLINAYWNVKSGQIHFLLDVIGLVPGAGEVADGINGGIYYLEGDKVSATLSFAAMVPVAGWVATAGKYARNVLKYDGVVNGVAHYVSKNGLTFTLLGKAENRLDHVFRHLNDIPPGVVKDIHGVFNGGSKEAVSLIDEAWETVKRNNMQPRVDRSAWIFEVEMGRNVGWQGGTKGTKGSLTKIEIITKADNNGILITAYPK